MWSVEVCSADFFAANRWTASYFKDAEGATLSAFPMCSIGSVVTERRGSTDPQLLGDAEITYLGLENVRSQTGELVDFAVRSAASVKSRSKIFKEDDVLYGRLRPELNKVFLVDGSINDGLCSGEFIVLVPNKRLILPRYLRHILASSFVTQFAAKFKVGASLPRMATADLLGIEIPIPPLDVQEKIANSLKDIDDEIVALRRRLSELPVCVSEALLSAIASGSAHLDI